MAAIRRCQQFFPTPPENVRQDIRARLNVSIRQERESCHKGHHAHMAQSLALVAIYEGLKSHEWSEEK